MSKNPAKIYSNTQKHIDELRNITQREWDKLSPYQKLSRIRLVQELDDPDLLSNIEYDEENLIKEHNKQRNDSYRKGKEEVEEINTLSRRIIKPRNTPDSIVNNSISSLNLKYESLKTKEKDYLERIERLECALNKKQEEVDGLKIDLDQSKERIEKLEDSLGEEKQEKNEIMNKISKLEEEHQKCKTTIRNLEAVTERHQLEISRLSQNNNLLIDLNLKNKDEIEKLKLKNNKRKEEMRLLRRTYNSLQEHYNKIQSTIDKMNNKLGDGPLSDEQMSIFVRKMFELSSNNKPVPNNE